MKRALWWALFLLAVIGLSQVFASLRGLGESAWAPFGLVLWSGATLGAVFVLGFLDYARFRARGELHHRFGPYEWLLRQVKPDAANGPEGGRG